MHGGTSDRPTDSAVRQHLDELLTAEEFSRSERRRELLAYLVVESLAGRGGALKAYTIGTAVLGRPSGFDPQVDPIVRVEVGRLRATLDRFYRARPDSPVVVSIPKGAYAAEFTAARPVVAPATLCFERFEALDADARTIVGAIDESVIRILAARVPRLEVAESCRADADGARPSAAQSAGGSTPPLVLLGTVRVVDGRLRCEAALRDGDALAPVWRAFVDETLDDHTFEIADRVAERVCWKLVDDFGVLPTRYPQVFTGAQAPTGPRLAGYLESFQVVQPGRLDAGRRSIEQVLSTAEGPDGAAVAALSDTIFTQWLMGAREDEADLERAEQLALDAVGAAPHLPDGHLAHANVHFARSRSELCRRALGAALELEPCTPRVLVHAGVILALDGRPIEGDELVRQAIEMNPSTPAWWRVVPCSRRIEADDLVGAYQDAVQLGGGSGFVGPLLRLSVGRRMGLEVSADAKAVMAALPTFFDDPAEYVGRVFHHPPVREFVLDGAQAP